MVDREQPRLPYEVGYRAPRDRQPDVDLAPRVATRPTDEPPITVDRLVDSIERDPQLRAALLKASEVRREGRVSGSKQARHRLETGSSAGVSTLRRGQLLLLQESDVDHRIGLCQPIDQCLLLSACSWRHVEMPGGVVT
jgi:hypothetical protein